ncbi:MAG: hypothetical protein EOO92_03655 [Pedobacter sp.]|nr:MAG: hypothetical protein EOO92_03655 [Pedobacter sp.]
MVRKLIGILLLFSLLAAKYSPMFANAPFKILVSTEQSAGDAEESKSGEEENKQSESPADELLHHYSINLSSPAISVKKVIPLNLGSTSEYLSSPYLPPEV